MIDDAWHVELLQQRYLTADEPGVGGTLKERPEDFLVEELPLYEPAGKGEHLYLFIEKKGRPTLNVVRDISRWFGVRTEAVGYAGMKDKQAVTRQYVSVHLPGRDPKDRLDSFDVPGVHLLWADRHTNKLRTGHLKGNRFIIRIRQVDPGLAPRVYRMMNRMMKSGVPNFIGEQRFGAHHSNHEAGKRYILQDWQGCCDVLLSTAHVDLEHSRETPARESYRAGDLEGALKAWPAHDTSEERILRALAQGREPYKALHAAGDAALRFYISAFQSAIFNRVLAMRLDAGLFDQCVPGDVLLSGSGRTWIHVTPERLLEEKTSQQLDQGILTPSGPMWGWEMERAAGRIDAMELACLNEAGVSIDDFSRDPLDVRGTRRPVRMSVSDTGVEAGVDDLGPYIQTSFTLPKGAFATTVLREVMKPTRQEADSEAASDSSAESEDTPG